MPENKPSQLPALTHSSSLERIYAERILRANPGMGDKVIEMANLLADSGLPGGAVNLLLQAVYAPDDAQGRGQATRMSWFIKAVQVRYKSRLELIRNDYRAFRSFVLDMEDVTTLHKVLKEEGYSISFHTAFDLWELGEDADSVIALIGEALASISHERVACVMRVKGAIQAVKDGQFTELATALRFLNQDHFLPDEQYDDPKFPDGLIGN